MMTIAACVMVLLLLVGVGCMVRAMMNGCAFAWLWYFMGGMESSLQLVGTLMKFIVEAFNNSDS